MFIVACICPFLFSSTILDVPLLIVCLKGFNCPKLSHGFSMNKILDIGFIIVLSISTVLIWNSFKELVSTTDCLDTQLVVSNKITLLAS